jgi:hypothetical protein
MSVSGLALKMQMELKALMRRHGYEAKQQNVALSAPVDGPLDLSGLASTTDIDLSRQRFKPYAFNNPAIALKHYPLPKLLYKHRENDIAGKIHRLGYDDHGNLSIIAEADHALAKRCNAFSIGATVLEYEIRDADTPDFHALITKAEIVEVSLTDSPANPLALVRSRNPAAPFAPYLKSMHDRFDLQVRTVQLMRQMLDVIAPHLVQAPPQPSAKARPRVEVEPYRAGSFGNLVRQIEERHHVD